MRVEPFNLQAHMPILCKWLYLRDAYIPSKDEMPAIGFVAYQDKMPIAMAFLRRVEGGHAQVDGLTSNPEALKEERHQGLDDVIQNVIEAAKSLKIKALTAWTRDEYTLIRSVRNGFTHIPDVASVAMRLGE